jgi:hypothetical protein
LTSRHQDFQQGGLLRAGLAALVLNLACMPTDLSSTTGEPVAQQAQALHRGSDFGVGDPYFLPTDAPHAVPAVASDGTNFLAAWVDDRIPGSREVFATRISPTLGVLDPLGVRLSTPKPETSTYLEPFNHLDSRGPAIAFGAGNYLVVWPRSTRPPSAPFAVLESALVSPSGSVTATTPALPVSTNHPLSSLRAFRLSVAFGADHFLAVWATAGNVYGLAFDRTGEPLTADAFTVATATGAGNAAVASDGENFLITWEAVAPADDFASIFATRVSPTGTALDATPLRVSTTRSARPAITFAGGRYFVAWEDSQARVFLSGANVTSEGDVGSTFPIDTNPFFASRSYPTVGFDGTSVLVAWERNIEIFGRRMTPDGQPLSDIRGLVFTNPFYYLWRPQLALGGGHALVVAQTFWSEGYNYKQLGDAIGVRLDAQDRPIDQGYLFLSKATPAQKQPRVAWAADKALLVWSEWGGQQYNILGLRLDARGQPLDAAPFFIAFQDFHQIEPDVASDGTQFLVVWSDQRPSGTDTRYELYGARVTAEGKAEPRMYLGPGARNALLRSAVAFNGRDYVVVWRSSDGSPSLYATRVPPGSNTAVPPVRVGNSQSDDRPGLGCANLQCVVLGAHQTNVYAVRIDADLQVLDTVPQRMPGSTPDDRNGAAVFDGTNYLLSWEVRSGSSTELRVARMSPSGVFLDTPPAVLASRAQYGRLTWDGSRAVAVWQERTADEQGWNIVGAEVLTGGAQLMSTSPVVLAQQPLDLQEPTVAGRNRRLILAWQAFAPDGGAYRVRVSPGSTLWAQGEDCTDSAQCVTGFCVEGVCCESACGGGSTGDCQACSVQAGAPQDGVCSPLISGESCDDGSACTVNDACNAGQCEGPPKAAPENNECLELRSCEPASGDFLWSLKPDGTPCTGGTCEAGACVKKGCSGCSGADTGSVLLWGLAVTLLASLRRRRA